MTSTVRRAAAFALVGSVSLGIVFAARIEEPAIATVVAAGPYLLLAAVALGLPANGTLFELFARPGDRRDGTLYGLAGFSLAAAGLAILAIQFGLPSEAYVGAVVLVSVGNFGGQAVRAAQPDPVRATVGFLVAGTAASWLATAGISAALENFVAWPVLGFLAASGALLAALLRAMLFQRDDPLVMISVALLLWLFSGFEFVLTPQRLAVALLVTAMLGYLSVALETASLPGMLTGVLLSLLTLVLGNVGWFALLIAFFGIGGLATKYRYEEKLDRGIAQENEGARGTGNVLANSLVALVAVLAGASSGQLDVSQTVFLYAFAGSLASALADTLSSEIGGLFDEPRLITGFRSVEPGTDGAVTWQGELAGVLGAAIIATIAWGLLGTVGVPGAVVILVAGFVGVNVDSLLGALLEGWMVGNQGVNLLSTLSAALVAMALAVGFGIATI